MSTSWIPTQTYVHSQEVDLLCNISPPKSRITVEDDFAYHAAFGPEAPPVKGNRNDGLEGEIEISHEEGWPFVKLSVIAPFKLIQEVPANTKFGYASVLLQIKIIKPGAVNFCLPPVVMCGIDCPCKIGLKVMSSMAYHVVDQYCPVEWIFQEPNGVTDLVQLRSMPVSVGFLNLKVEIKMTSSGVHAPMCPMVKASAEAMSVTMMKQLLSDRSVSDVTVRVEDEEFHVHSLILSANSQVFAAMFGGNFREGQEKVVEIEDMSRSVMKAFISFLYYRDVEAMQDQEVSISLLEVAEKYGVADLKNMAERIIISTPVSRFSVSAGLYGFYYGELLGLPRVVKHSVDALKLKGNEIQQSDDFKKFTKTNVDAVPKLVALLLS